jgi:predicted HNH restriction endonuclease
MVQAGRISRTAQGVYRLNQPMVSVVKTAWEELLTIDKDISDPQVQKSNVRRIQRSQRLRDNLINYYRSRCQICEDHSSYLIPTEMPDRYYVEVHHVNGLAESYALQREGLLVGLRVNGLGNLTVLCPHHHATIHHHWPRYEFDRSHLLWRHDNGGKLLLHYLNAEHADALKSALV